MNERYDLVLQRHRVLFKLQVPFHGYAYPAPDEVGQVVRPAPPSH